MHNLDKELEVAQLAAVEAGKILLSFYDSPKGVEMKSDKTLVSEADKQSSKKISHILNSAFPQYSIIDEEKINEIATIEFCWVIDPLDGTREYLEKSTNFGILIGLTKNGIPILGLAYRPLTGEMMYSTKGRGSWVKNKDGIKKIQVSASKEINLLISASRPSLELDELISLISPDSIRKMGSAFKITEVAAGRATLYLAPKENTMHLWDVCGPSIILEEAGGKITDLEGKNLSFTDPQTLFENGILVCPKELHSIILRKLNKSQKNE